jgi:23S rRNA (cytidine2498-2'-O)-methyltransferase
MGQWLREGWCRYTIFNLKLPMKKRWLETQRSLAMFEEEAGLPLFVRARQLYHDREEVTVHARPRTGR